MRRKAGLKVFMPGSTVFAKGKNGKEESIKGSDIGYQVTVSGNIQEILDNQNASRSCGRTFRE